MEYIDLLKLEEGWQSVKLNFEEGNKIDRASHTIIGQEDKERIIVFGGWHQYYN